jgi:methylase of polypeptide subunit release factors
MRTTVRAHEDPSAVAELGKILRAAGFDPVRVGSALGVKSALSTRTDALAELLARLPAGAALSTLIRLLVLGFPVDPHELNRALSPLGLARLEGLGLLQRFAEGQITSTVRIVPYGQLLVACDHEGNDGTLPRDHVPGVHSSSVLLANLTPRSHSSSTLDLGAGCGIQSLLAAAHSEHVVASDINPRALAFTAFNALLNGIEPPETREGSAFGPVADEVFDLIVCNPPYVISPESTYDYRDSGLDGDELCKKLIHEVRQFVADRGFACILISWALRRGQDWWEPPVQWLPAGDFGVLVLKVETVDALTNASRWIRLPQGASLAAHQETLARWRDYYERNEIEFVGYGAVVLRRLQDGRSWRCFETLHNGPTAPGGDQIERIFANQEYLGGFSNPDELLHQAFSPVPNLQLDQSLHYAAASWVPSSPATVREGTLGIGRRLTPLGMKLLTSMDGRRTLGELLEAMHPGHRLPGAVGLITELVGCGLLTPQAIADEPGHYVLRQN